MKCLKSLLWIYSILKNIYHPEVSMYFSKKGLYNVLLIRKDWEIFYDNLSLEYAILPVQFCV